MTLPHRRWLIPVVRFLSTQFRNNYMCHQTVQCPPTCQNHHQEKLYFFLLASKLYGGGISKTTRPWNYSLEIRDVYLLKLSNLFLL